MSFQTQCWCEQAKLERLSLAGILKPLRTGGLKKLAHAITKMIVVRFFTRSKNFWSSSPAIRFKQTSEQEHLQVTGFQVEIYFFSNWSDKLRQRLEISLRYCGAFAQRNPSPKGGRGRRDMFSHVYDSSHRLQGRSEV